MAESDPSGNFRMKRTNLEQVIEQYVRLVNALQDDEYFDTVVIPLLGARDVLFDKWHHLTKEQRNMVWQADAALVQKWRIVAQMLPADCSDPRRWWWLLDKGPQVREKAEEY